MSDSFDFSELCNFNFKKSRFIFPLNYLKEILNGIKKLVLHDDVLLDIKSSPLNLYNRLFGIRSRRHISNVLVLIADLESNVGAACTELLNPESQENFKNFNYIHNFSYNDDNFDDNYYMHYDAPISNNENIFEYPVLDNNLDCVKEESKILEANLYNDENIDNQINPEYLLQLSLSSDYSISTICELQSNEIKKENYDESHENMELKAWDWNSFDTSSFTEASITENSYEESGDKENSFSDCESDCSSYNFNDDRISLNNITSLPKPIKREIYQLKMLRIPFDYYDITQSSHEVFKTMKSRADLTKSQISAMTNARRRYINRRAATRCRTQKLQQKDKLKLEFKRLQNQLIEKKITLTKAYQQRNEMRDQFRIMQKSLVIRLQGPEDKVLNPKRWSSELRNKSLVLIEKLCSS